MALTTGTMLVSSAALALAALALPGGPTAGRATVVVLAPAAMVAGAAYVRAGDRAPRWSLHALLAASSLMVTLGVVTAGEGTIAVAYTMFFVLVVCNAFGSCSWAGASGHLVVASVGTAVGLTSLQPYRPALVVMVVGVMTLTCALLGRLVRAASQAEVDALTGLPNRRGLERRLDAELARAARTREPLALAAVDLDHFKEVNDLEGHEAGDRLLRLVARAWSARLQDGAMLARWGGDEFVLVIPEATAADAVRAVARLRSGMPPGRSCTAGAATLAPGESASTLTSRADAALYAAKRSRRGTTCTALDVEVSPFEQLVDLSGPAGGAR